MNLDPKAEDYYFQSTYTFAANSPIIFIDFNGEGVLDDYGVDQNGKIELIKKTDDATDTLYSVTRNANGELAKDTNGEVIRNDANRDGTLGDGDSVTVNKGVLDSIENTTVKDSDGITQNVQIMEVTNSGKSQELFEFISGNSSNEISYSSWFSDRQFISTSFQTHAENSINVLYPRFKYLLHHVHSHPDPYLSPSPGDNSVAKILRKRLGYKPRFEIYSPFLGEYKDYDENTPFDSLDEVIIVAPKKKK